MVVTAQLLLRRRRMRVALCEGQAIQVIISIGLAAVNFPKRWYSSQHHHRHDNISHQHSSPLLFSAPLSSPLFCCSDRLSIDCTLINMLYINLPFEIRPSAECKTCCDSDRFFIGQMPWQLMEIDNKKTQCPKTTRCEAWSKAKQNQLPYFYSVIWISGIIII